MLRSVLRREDAHDAGRRRMSAQAGHGQTKGPVDATSWLIYPLPKTWIPFIAKDFCASGTEASIRPGHPPPPAHALRRVRTPPPRAGGPPVKATRLRRRLEAEARAGTNTAVPRLD